MHRFSAGDNVRIVASGAVGTINAVLERDGDSAYRVTVGGKTTVYQEKYLEAFIDTEQEVLGQLASSDFADADSFGVFHTAYRLQKPLEGSYYSYLASKTLFNPYQFKPLIKFLSPGSDERLFIADEVGVGKTIETGIILTELMARERLHKKSPILIVCPNTLAIKWQKEMQERFNLDFHIHNGETLAYTLRCALNEHRIPDKYLWGIVGLQLIRGEKYLEWYRQVSAKQDMELYSMLVVDEAHHMRNPSTLSNETGNVLSGLSEMVLMLSATPLNLRDDDLFNQMHILNPGLFPDGDTFAELLEPIKSLNRCRRLLSLGDRSSLGKEIVSLEGGSMGAVFRSHPGWTELRNRSLFPLPFTSQETAKYERLLTSLSPLDNSFTRTLKREAFEHRVTREAIKVPVLLSEDEAAFHDAIIRLTIQAFEERGGHPAASGFVSTMPRRMASSCIPAMRQYIDYCLANDSVAQANFEDDEAEDDTGFGSVPMLPETRRQFLELRDLATSLSENDSKYNEFVALLRRMQSELSNPQVMVFSFFVRTLHYLRKRLESDGFRVGLISGAVPMTSDGDQIGRYEIMDSFKNGEFDILLSSEVGGEGLDFQFCQALVNYDLPYNPMRVEQRIGRIDRFGQNAEKILVASMYILGTVDEVIYERLYERIRLVEDSVGALEPILGKKLLDLQKDILTGRLNKEQLAERARELELSVEQAKLEMQQFENGRQELLGEDTFEQMFSNLTKSNDFVGPADIGALTGHLLARSTGCRYVQVDENRATLVLSEAMRQKIEMFLRRPGNEGGYRELQALLTSKETPVLFNGSLAHNFTDHVFLPACGAWSRFVLAEVQSGPSARQTFRLACKSYDVELPPGHYLVPLFEIATEGFRKELRLAAVPYCLATDRIAKTDYVDLTRQMGRLGYAPNIETPYRYVDYESAIELCRRELEDSMEVHLQELRTEHQFRQQARVQSLKNAAKAKVRRLRNRISEYREKSLQPSGQLKSEYIRLIEAQIAAENTRCDERIRRLMASDDVSLSVSLIAAVWLSVELEDE